VGVASGVFAEDHGFGVVFGADDADAEAGLVAAGAFCAQVLPVEAFAELCCHAGADAAEALQCAFLLAFCGVGVLGVEVVELGVGVV
jgi:hypothetical protein